ncbi:MAG: alpha/beta hydrolase [Clostridia bacterium]|nr:alpha/beta hydrolase [Clostridia bacterium]
MEPAKKRSRLLRWIALGLLLALLAGTAVYFSTYYPATEEALAVISRPAAGITVEELPGERIAFVPEQPVAGLIFYPGGKVQYEAYAPLMEACARRGVLCVLVHMPFNLAVFSPNAAGGIQSDYPEVERWYIGGHSLGGVMAASYAAAHPEELEGLLLLAAWSTEDLRRCGLSALTVTGTEDGVLNLKKYEENLIHLPMDAVTVNIEGGNHAQFGSYGPQRGDGTAAISPEKQWEHTADAVALWIAKEN